ncbi:helix-turn-helix domain-containing protein [Halarchaeum grantii]|uniref:Helix-turn-helix domain-containing protein n=1 Tax=Halarchaeum grantii TaxID=1193105 RepID=A0A830EXQ4_9EURY|nr:helix-turn-helix domain-containing protein [Halarchaeum grantii]GGL42259.1 helix-turn-helix domain-containing protein [Halarchaeum grantii]
MPRAELTVTVPEGIWIGDVSRRFAADTFRVLTAFADEETGVGLLELDDGTDSDAIRDAMTAHETIQDVTTLYDGEEDVLLQFETADPVLLLPLRESGVPLEFPFEIRDGAATWTLRAPSERLGALRDQFSAFGIDFTLERIRDEQYERDAPLTERQRDVLATAVAVGYYETPRDATLTDVADELGIAKSTCSETLHRAEATVIAEFAERADLLED